MKSGSQFRDRNRDLLDEVPLVQKIRQADMGYANTLARQYTTSVCDPRHASIKLLDCYYWSISIASIEESRQNQETLTQQDAAIHANKLVTQANKGEGK
jgi:hypothetical protein